MDFRYVFSGLAVAGIFAFGVVTSGADFAWYLDLPSVAMILAPTFVLALGDFGAAGVGKAFALAFGKKAASGAELRLAAAAAAALGRYAWYSAALGSFVGAVAILAGTGLALDPKKLGANMAVALICAFYATLFNFAVVAPMKNRLAARLAREEEGEDRR